MSGKCADVVEFLPSMTLRGPFAELTVGRMMGYVIRLIFPMRGDSISRSIFHIDIHDFRYLQYPA